MWNFPLTPDRASTMAGHVDALMVFLLLMTTFFSLLIAGLIIYFAVKYRASDKTVNREGAPDSHLLLEIIWTGIPLVIVMFVFIWGTGLFYKFRTMPPNAVKIQVVGKQWMWKIQHPEGQREINALHIPINEAVQLEMISEDVVHDFSIPAFRVKQDVIPGHYTNMWFQPTKVGRYHLFCDQYCGTLHANMVGEVVVMERRDYEAWLAKGAFPTESGAASAAPTPASAGEELFTKMGCVSCHLAGGQGRAPSLVGLYGKKVALKSGQLVTADDEYLRESILKPAAKVVAGYEPIMPIFLGQLTEENVLELIQYIKSLKGPIDANAQH
jgi:cytochrome c oxidase subunit 2